MKELIFVFVSMLETALQQSCGYIENSQSVVQLNFMIGAFLQNIRWK